MTEPGWFDAGPCTVHLVVGVGLAGVGLAGVGLAGVGLD